MLKCRECGHVEKCCHFLCPNCGAKMEEIEDIANGMAPEGTRDQVMPIAEEVARSKCRECGDFKELVKVTDYHAEEEYPIGICAECRHVMWSDEA